MLKLHCKFTTDKGTLSAGLVDEKELKKHFKKDEIEAYISQGLISKIEMPDDITEEGDALDISELLDAPKSSLKVSELKKVCEYYKLSTSGNKDDLIERIEHFDTLLVLDLDEVEDEDLKLLANYAGIDLSLDREAMVLAIEEASA